MLTCNLLDAATTNTGMRGVTNGAGTIGNTGRAAGVVSADVMPSSTNQGGGIRPTVSRPLPCLVLYIPACKVLTRPGAGC